MLNIFPWKKLEALPAPSGYKENIGLSNSFYGILDNKIIVGGGSNFPVHPLDGGPRVCHNDIFLLKDNEDSFKILDKTSVNYNITDGKSVVFNNILFYIGNNKIIKINIINNKLHIESYFDLPFTITNHVAEIYDGIIYYGLGQLDGEVSNKMFAFNIFTKENVEIPDFPAASRAQATATIFKDNLVIFSGGSNVAYFDSYKYNITKKMWYKIADVELNTKNISLIGARAVNINAEECLITGGFDADVWNEANLKLSTLIGEEKQKFREFYFKQDFSYYNWNKELLVYNYIENSWRTVGQLPFHAPCGHCLLNNGSNIYVLMGEIRPGERTANMYKITIADLIK